MTESGCVLLTRDEATADQVQAVAAALGVSVDTLASPHDCLARWADAAGPVLVGGDAAAGLAALSPRPRPDVYLIGPDPAPLARWSVPLGGQVLVLPQGAAALSAVLGDTRGAGGPIVSILGGSGGVGASTLAAGLALAARHRGRTAALVDLDAAGGGIDLLLGAERTPGWRWPQLLGARGEVSDVRRFLPQVDGLTVVSMGRTPPGETAPGPPSAESVRAVLGALARHHDLIVVDPGRTLGGPARAALAASRATLLLTGSSVRAVAAAAAFTRIADLVDAHVVVRAIASSRVPAELVARALGLPVLGVLPDDRGLPRAAEEGEPPGRSGRRHWTKAVGRLLVELGVGRDG